MLRIAEEFAHAKQVREVTSFEEALRRGKEQRDDEHGGQAITYLWRAVELSEIVGHSSVTITLQVYTHVTPHIQQTATRQWIRFSKAYDGPYKRSKVQ